MLISDILRDQLKADVSVLMGANVANDMATDQFCETTIGCALTGREESHGSSRGSGAERSWQKEAEDGVGGRGTGWLRVGRGRGRSIHPLARAEGGERRSSAVACVDSPPSLPPSL